MKWAPDPCVQIMCYFSCHCLHNTNETQFVTIYFLFVWGFYVTRLVPRHVSLARNAKSCQARERSSVTHASNAPDQMQRWQMPHINCNTRDLIDTLIFCFVSECDAAQQMQLQKCHSPNETELSSFPFILLRGLSFTRQMQGNQCYTSHNQILFPLFCSNHCPGEQTLAFL